MEEVSNEQKDFFTTTSGNTYFAFLSVEDEQRVHTRPPSYQVVLFHDPFSTKYIEQVIIPNKLIVKVKKRWVETVVFTFSYFELSTRAHRTKDSL